MPRNALVVPGQYPVVNPIKTSGTYAALDMLPGGHQIRGGNVVARNNYTGSTSGSEGTASYIWWAQMWSAWEWSNPPAGGGGSGNWIKPQIDALAALGGNCITMHGTVGGRYGGTSTTGQTYPTISLATYLTQWNQVLAYCRSIGMYVYPALCPDSTIIAAGYNVNPSYAWYISEYTSLVQLFDAYADIVIGVDLFTEASQWYSALTGSTLNGAPIYNAVKAAAPRLKYTCSVLGLYGAMGNPPNYGQGGADWNDIRIVDFDDFHAYYGNGPADFDGMIAYRMNQTLTAGYAGYTPRPLIIGEFGNAMSAGTGGRQGRYNAMSASVSRAKSAPGNPTVAFATTGGTVQAGAYQVQVSYVSGSGETVGSEITTVSPTGTTATITITSPQALPNATGWYAYVSQLAGSTQTRQQTPGSPTAIGTNLTLTAPPLSSGAQPLATDTSGLVSRRVAGALCWSIAPQDVYTGNDWGLCDGTITARTDVESIFQAMPN